MAEVFKITSQEAEAMRGRIGKARQEFLSTVAAGFREYGEILQNELYEQTPFDKGLLRETVRAQVENEGTKKVALVVTMGTGDSGDRPDVIVKTLLFGRKETTIRPKPPSAGGKGFLAWKGAGGKWVFTRKPVHQPARRGHRFDSDAWKNTANARRRMVYRVGKITAQRITGNM